MNKSPFSGRKGVDKQGNPASVGLPSSEQFSFAPAIEYNFTENFGIITGVWLSAFGRNSPRFRTGIVNIDYNY